MNFVRCKLGSVRLFKCINQSDNSIESSVDEFLIWRTLKKIFGVNRDRPLIPFGVNVFYPMGLVKQIAFICDLKSWWDIFAFENS